MSTLQEWSNSCVSPKRLDAIRCALKDTYDIVQTKIKEGEKYEVLFLANDALNEIMGENENEEYGGVAVFEINSFSMASKRLDFALDALFNEEIPSVSDREECLDSDEHRKELGNAFRLFLEYVEWNKTTAFVIVERQIEDSPFPSRKSIMQKQGVTISFQFPSAPGKPSKRNQKRPATRTRSLTYTHRLNGGG
eukprot:GHVO01058740.1.p1 GENE.GHVO01058740.1~~GHVO01058740.1.p1  ORF type:complete len:194 (+),score=18.52 GHVO01058740.1:290-871(+)